MSEKPDFLTDCHEIWGIHQTLRQTVMKYGEFTRFLENSNGVRNLSQNCHKAWSIRHNFYKLY